MVSKICLSTMWLRFLKLTILSKRPLIDLVKLTHLWKLRIPPPIANFKICFYYVRGDSKDRGKIGTVVDELINERIILWSKTSPLKALVVRRRFKQDDSSFSLDFAKFSYISLFIPIYVVRLSSASTFNSPDKIFYSINVSSEITYYTNISGSVCVVIC